VGRDHPPAELLQGELGDLLQGLEDAHAVDRLGLEERVRPFGVEVSVQLVNSEGVLEVALVVLEDQRQFADVEAELGQVVD
jgi:hypothetical protein